MLLVDPGLLYEDARVATTAALGLLCLYFLTTCRMNRSVGHEVITMANTVTGLGRSVVLQ